VGGEHLLGEIARLKGDYGGAEAAFARARAVCKVSGDHVNLVMLDAELAFVQLSLGRCDQGYQDLEAATKKWEAYGFSGANFRALLAEVALKCGDLASARQQLATSSIPLAGGNDERRPSVLRAAARVAHAEGRPHKALGLACLALQTAFSAGALLAVTELLELAAMVSFELGENAEAARLLGAAELQRELNGYVCSGPDLAELAPVRAGVAATLGPDAAERATMEGRASSLAAVVSYAARRRTTHRRAASGWDSLTPTERQVAFLVSKRFTNAEIAERLFVSVVTVKSHLSRVFLKLGVANRRQLAALAVAHEDEVGP